MVPRSARPRPGRLRLPERQWMLIASLKDDDTVSVLERCDLLQSGRPLAPQSCSLVNRNDKEPDQAIPGTPRPSLPLGPSLPLLLSPRAPGIGCAVTGPARPPETPYPAEVQMLDDHLRHRLHAVVVARTTFLPPEALRLVQRKLDREQQVLPGNWTYIFLFHARYTSIGTIKEQNDSLLPMCSNPVLCAVVSPSACHGSNCTS